MMLERRSIELTNRCAKGCWFCYNSSHGEGGVLWTPDEVVSFVCDCAAHGTRAEFAARAKRFGYRVLLLPGGRRMRR